MNARLRIITLSSLLVFAAFSTVLYSSCSEDKCKAIVCAYNGVCTGGTCLCPSGYEGPQCETINRERYKGVWQVTEDGTLSSAAQYPVSIENGKGDVTTVEIKNFRNLYTAPITGHVKGDTLSLDHQTASNGDIVDGFGVISDDKYYGDHGLITFYYSITLTNGSIDYFGLGQGMSSLWSK